MMKWLQPALALLVLAGALLLRLFDPPILSDFRSLMFDQYQRLAPRPYTPDLPVRIVDIDDESLAQLGQWPWPRNLFAQLLEQLRKQGVLAVGLDMVFAEPDRAAPARMLSTWGIPPDDPIGAELAHRVADPDGILAREIAQGRVVTGFVLVGSDTGKAAKRKAGLASMFGKDVDPKKLVPQFGGVVPNIPVIEQAAQGSGSINVVPDRDGIVRRVPMILNGGGTLVPSLSAEVLRVALGEKQYILRASGSQKYKRLFTLSGEKGIGEFSIGKAGKNSILTDPTAQVWLHDSGHRAERFVSAWKVIAGQAPSLRGAIVFIGTSAAGLQDLRSTPKVAAIPGVEIHAQIVEQIITGDLLQRPIWADDLESGALLIMGIAMIGLLPWLRPIGCAIFGGSCVQIAYVLGGWAFAELGWLLDPLYPSAGAGAVFLTMLMLSFQRSDVERRQVRETFSHYLSPAMVKRLVANPSLLRLGGEVRNLTIMFCDIRDFTTISEKMEATALTALLNDFLTPMSEAVIENGGTIDKYIGDSIMAFWNAPLDDPDHARQACRATLEMRRRLAVLNKTLAERAKAAGQDPTLIMIGIGLNSGDALVGNLGARGQRLNYSVIGDNVNLASRIEGVSKSFGLDILIGEQTRNAAPDFAAIPIGDIFVKGKTLPARLYALIGGPEVAQSPNAHELLDEIAKAAQCFKSGNLAAAGAGLAAARKLGERLGLEPLFDHMGNALAAAEHKAKGAAAAQ
jgi:adenylate cyclase